MLDEHTCGRGLVRPAGRRSGVEWLDVLAGLLLFPLQVEAQGPGDLDTSFDVDGIVQTDFSGTPVLQLAETWS